MFSGTVFPQSNTVIFALSSPASLPVSDYFSSPYECSMLIKLHGFPPLKQCGADFKQDTEDHHQQNDTQLNTCDPQWLHLASFTASVWFVKLCIQAPPCHLSQTQTVWSIDADNNKWWLFSVTFHLTQLTPWVWPSRFKCNFSDGLYTWSVSSRFDNSFLSYW